MTEQKGTTWLGKSVSRRSVRMAPGRKALLENEERSENAKKTNSVRKVDMAGANEGGRGSELPE